MKTLECVICGHDIKVGKTRRRFCIHCLEVKARVKFKRIRNKRCSRL